MCKAGTKVEQTSPFRKDGGRGQVAKLVKCIFIHFPFFIMESNCNLRNMLHRDPLKTLCTFFTLSPFISQSKKYEYVCTYTYICMHVCIHTYRHLCTYRCPHRSVYTYKCVITHMYTQIYVFVNILILSTLIKKLCLISENSKDIISGFMELIY